MVFPKLSIPKQRKTMLIKTLLNKVERFKSFVYGSICVLLVGGTEALIIDFVPRRKSRPRCPECCKRCTVYDRQPARFFEYFCRSGRLSRIFVILLTVLSVQSMGLRLSLCLGGTARSRWLFRIRFSWLAGREAAVMARDRWYLCNQLEHGV